MKKNYFKIMAIAIMVMTGVSFTSCDEQLDNPVVDPTEAETEDLVIEETAQGAKITINKLSAVSSFIDELKTVIEKFQTENPGKQFVLDIETTATLEATETDYTLLIPNLSEFNIVINLNGNLVTSAKPLTLKLDQKAGTRDEVGEKIKTNYDNVITLNLKNDDIDLILDVPGTTVFINKLNSIQILNGVSILKDGGSINTYVWAPTRNDYEMNNGEPEWVKFTESGDDYRPNVSYTNGDPYCFKNLKIVKGKADYAKINVWDENRKLDKLTIAEGLTVVLNYSPYIKEIVGEGNGAILKSSSIWWTDEEKKTVATDISLYGVDKISNITIEPLLDGDYKEGKIERSTIYSAPVDIENVTFKMGYVAFRNPNATSAAVKNCKFESDVNDRRVEIAIPGQTETINAFKFNFENCEFSENVIFYNYIVTSKPKLDANGKVVYEDVYHWVVYDEAGNYLYETSSNNEANIPESTKAVGLLENGSWTYNEETQTWEAPKGYWINQEIVYEEITFKDFYATISFKDCKYAGKTMTAESFHFNGAWLPTGAYLRYEFDGKVYRAIQMYDPEKEGDKYTWMLVEVND
jgi:hypothetical protein